MAFFRSKNIDRFGGWFSWQHAANANRWALFEIGRLTIKKETSMKARLLSVVILIIIPLFSGLPLQGLEAGSQIAKQQGIAYASW